MEENDIVPPRILERTDFSFRKFKRKVKADGITSALVAAPELLVRKKLGRPVFNHLVENGTIRLVSRDELLNMSSPAYMQDSNKELKNQSVRTPFVTKVDGGYIFPETGLAATNQLEILEESVSQPQNSRQFVMAALSRHYFFDQLRVTRWFLYGDRSETSVEEFKIASPLSPRHPNYYHWMIETVPRIRYLREYEEQTGNDVTVLVPDGLPSWADETLALLGWPESKIKRTTSPVYRVDQLILPSFPELIPEDYQWIRRRVLDNTAPTLGSDVVGKNVYISRSNAVERQVINENEVMQVLSNYNFERFHLEDLSISQNAHLFSNADLIVGAHGAGLTDLIFCTDGSVLELFGSKVKPPYERLASILDVEYDSLECTPKSTDILVDTQELETKVQRMLKNKNG